MDMNKEFLKTVLSIPSIYHEEHLVREFIENFAKDNGIEYYIDEKGNIYLTKGELSEGEYYPCVVSHMDTVHRGHKELVDSRTHLNIVESVYERAEDDTYSVLIAKHPHTDKQTGIGGDDKCGVYVCLEMLLRFDTIKAAFFVEEEIGMRGSKEADDAFFENVGYAIQFDAPSDNWISEVCSGVKLFDSEFKERIKGVLSESGYTKFSRDPFTDVNQLAQKYEFNCLNLGCGYYRQHSDSEYVVIDEVANSVIAGEKLITDLGCNLYTHNKEESNQPFRSEHYHSYGVQDMGDYQGMMSRYEEQMKQQMRQDTEDVVSIVIKMYEDGCSEEEIIDEVGEILYETYFY
jgi:di/tripeptidase